MPECLLELAVSDAVILRSEWCPTCNTCINYLRRSILSCPSFRESDEAIKRSQVTVREKKRTRKRRKK
jgi:hypothetical protein